MGVMSLATRWLGVFPHYYIVGNLCLFIFVIVTAWNIDTSQASFGKIKQEDLVRAVINNPVCASLFFIFVYIIYYFD
jgi:hypothetical protein